MKAEITEDQVIITLPRIRQVSKSGKSMNIASTLGNKPAGIQVDGKDVIVGVNVYYPN